jgi:hypothetical protein
MFSIESGLADNVLHFDHHKPEHKHYPCPANNPAIQGKASIEAYPHPNIVQITHCDADTFIGWLRLQDYPIPNIDLTILERIDTQSSFGIPKDNPTLVWMVGLNTARDIIGFPRAAAEPKDVSEYMEQLRRVPGQIITWIGKKAIERTLQTHTNCLKESQNKVGLWAIGENDPFDATIAYDHDYQTVIVYRKHHKAISIYAHPESDLHYANRSFAGILFQGHPKACGSPRGIQYSLKDAIAVFNEIA